MLFGKIKALVEYGVHTGLIEAEDMIYTRNRLLEALCEEDYADEEAEQSENLALLLDGLCDEAVKRGIIEDGATSRDLFDTKLMGLLTPRPSDVNRTFRALYKESPEKATDWFYKLCSDCNYIRRDRVAREVCLEALLDAREQPIEAAVDIAADGALRVRALVEMEERVAAARLDGAVDIEAVQLLAHCADRFAVDVELQALDDLLGIPEPTTDRQNAIGVSVVVFPKA